LLCRSFGSRRIASMSRWRMDEKTADGQTAADPA
jgi:hypothetical protein